ncbi:MAG: ATP-binding protein, partial [Defluviitaleaceae bacterium]|nr:ATP-binding protein [Defluviitaleaceae bacterium]
MLNNSDAIQMLNNLPGMVYRAIISPRNLMFTFASKGCIALTGYTPEELAGEDGKALFELVYPSDIEVLKDLQDTTLGIGMPIETTFRLVTKYGEEKWVWLRSQVVDTDENGMPHVVEGFCTDVTKQLNNEVAVQANKAKFNFLSKMSHDIRTPMNVIIGMAEMGMRDDFPEEFREFPRAIKKAGTKLMITLNDILDYTNIESGNLGISVQEYTLSSLINDIISVIKAYMDGSGLRLLVHVDSKLPNVLVGDAIRVRHIILELLGNAVKFTDSGHISLIVSGEENGDMLDLNVMVEDTGRGIKEEDTGRIFDAFAQFDLKNIEGGGLGLTIVKNLVDLMEGDVVVSSLYGVGTIMHVNIPQKIGNKNPICYVEDAAGKHVLIYEDRQIYRDSIVQTLANLGASYQIKTDMLSFRSGLASGRFGYAFVATELYAQFKETHKDWEPDTKIVLIAEPNEAPTGFENEVDILTAPVYCLPVADILGDVFRDGYYSRINSAGGDSMTH